MTGIDLRDISHAFGNTQVLDRVSLSVRPGELVCLLGPSGCGKTTLLRLAAGLEELQEGVISIGGRSVAHGGKGPGLPPERRGVGLMFQDFALFPHLNVRENIGFGTDTRDPARQAWIDAALLQMGLADTAGMYPHTLSGGQQQRVALLRALAPAPSVLLLDEPFSGLDVGRRAQVRADTLRLVKNSGVATLMVTHDPEEAMFMADRIHIMNAGRIVQGGSPTELYFEPADAFVTEFFGPVNRFHGAVSGGAVETPLGRFTVSGFADDTPVDVLIRVEGLRVAGYADAPEGEPDDNAGRQPASVTLEVETARPLGRSSYVVFKLAGGGRAIGRIPGMFLPATGERIEIAVNPRQAHVFSHHT